MGSGRWVPTLEDYLDMGRRRAGDRPWATAPAPAAESRRGVVEHIAAGTATHEEIVAWIEQRTIVT